LVLDEAQMTHDVDWTPAVEQRKEKTVTDGPSKKLVYQVTSQDSGPDRVTVSPPDVTGIKKSSTWLTVDADCVVDLECFR